MKNKNYIPSWNKNDLIYEMAIAKKGDWIDGFESLGSYTETIINLKWEIIDTFNFNFSNDNYEFRKLRNSLTFILGNWDTKQRNTKLGLEEYTEFIPILKLELSNFKSLRKSLKLGKIVNVDSAIVMQKYNGQGLGLFIYKYIVNELGYAIICDEHQFFGARKLWAKLSKQVDVQVDLVDIQKKEIIERDVILYYKVMGLEGK